METSNDAEQTTTGLKLTYYHDLRATQSFRPVVGMLRK